ncbi:hypothetical protein G7Z17_g12136 [Cylindrodendrum hubeiense]|uniref:Uncharacterized protein n=1 Tax=Cylindrodendrum hubeiense TaxID=595255 RepID=A0A9P5L5R7_9HYPO|nr:hypothetical protein G7Z17_g12136 [Cylindrodendrum hubeiense]
MRRLRRPALSLTIGDGLVDKLASDVIRRLLVVLLGRQRSAPQLIATDGRPGIQMMEGDSAQQQESDGAGVIQ